ncbi:hypothetical protein [Kitasatospora sp. SUK 42]|nr:hypothetical protein [Kitasatospora sp. SUK 42]MBV2154680.1 hypothetical protein [Kitasatospora sp. SUK 42]
MFNRTAYSTPVILNAFEMTGVVNAAPDAEGAFGAANTDDKDTGWNLVSD